MSNTNNEFNDQVLYQCKPLRLKTNQKILGADIDSRKRLFMSDG
jgi:hypothetical protein